MYSVFQTTAQLPSFQPVLLGFALPSLPQALRTAQPITHTLLLPAERLTHGTTPNKLEALVHWSSPACCCCCQQPQPPPRGLRGQPVGRQQSLSRWHHCDGAQSFLGISVPVSPPHTAKGDGFLHRCPSRHAKRFLKLHTPQAVSA